MIIRDINIPRVMLDTNIRHVKVQLQQDEQDFQSYDIAICFSNGLISHYTGKHADITLEANPRIREHVEDIIRHQVKQEFNLDRQRPEWEAGQMIKLPCQCPFCDSRREKLRVFKRKRFFRKKFRFNYQRCRERRELIKRIDNNEKLTVTYVLKRMQTALDETKTDSSS